MRLSLRARWCALLLAAALSDGSAVPAQQGAPVRVRQLGPIVASVKDSLGTYFTIRALSDGRLLVNDGGHRRLLLYDSSLARATVLLDTTGATPRSYPTTSGAVLPFVGDSSLYYDPQAAALLVLDPAGRIARIVSAPFPPDAGYLYVSFARFDAAGRVVYRASVSPLARPTSTGYRIIPADSSPIVRAAPGAVVPDTLGWVRAPRLMRTEPFKTDKGPTVNRGIINPFNVIDEWTITSDGTIAMVRGQDYHIDWVSSDGKRSSSPKLPFQWHRLSDAEKVTIVDSVKAWGEAHPSCGTWSNATGTFAGCVPYGVVPADSLPDYRAPFARGAMLADNDNNVWILATPEVPLVSTPGPVYDVVNRIGGLVDRVQIPGGTTIVGFGPGVVYLSSRTGTTSSLVRARIH